MTRKRFTVQYTMKLEHQMTFWCAFLKPNSWTYKIVEVSGHNLESSQTWGFRIQCLHYKPVSNHFCSGGGGGEAVKSVWKWRLWIQRRKTLLTSVPITSKNSPSGACVDLFVLSAASRFKAFRNTVTALFQLLKYFIVCTYWRLRWEVGLIYMF